MQMEFEKGSVPFICPLYLVQQQHDQLLGPMHSISQG
jgi:hypothetical protein